MKKNDQFTDKSIFHGVNKLLKSNMYHSVRFAVFIFIISMAIVACLGILVRESTFSSGNTVYRPQDNFSQTFTINEGDHLDIIAERLEKEGFIENERDFRAYIKNKADHKTFRPGQYRLSPAMPLKKIAIILTRPDGAERRINIQKGSTIYDIQKLFKKHEICNEDEFWRVVEEGKFEGFNFLPKIKGKSRLEGYLFPDAYTYQDNMDAEFVLSLMLENYAKHIKEIPKRTNGLSDNDTVILASMLEKEARSDGEKPLIASVYMNRLHKDMPLQCDATILYDKPGHQGALTFADYEYKTPYNTYLHKGFPPTPICNPSMTSLIAASNPAKSDYYFYLYNTQSKNAHVFAKTYEEHKKNREIYGYDN